jgi:glutamate synthase (ferredoxin)
VEPLSEKYDISELRDMLTEHVKATGSLKAKAILAEFDLYIRDFKKIVPRDYSRMLEKIAEFEAKGLTREQAEMEAFTKREA